MRKRRQARIPACEPLEDRLVLSTFSFNPPDSPKPSTLTMAEVRAARAAARSNRLATPRPRVEIGHRPPIRPSSLHRARPTEFIDASFRDYARDVAMAFQAYLTSASGQSSGTTTTVTQVLAAPSAAGSLVLPVANASVFGTPSPTSPLVVTVSNGQAVEGVYLVTSIIGNNLILASGPASSLPAGATVQATIVLPPANNDNTATLYPSYLQQRTVYLSQKLVDYYNSLPIRLPKTPPLFGQSSHRTAIQLYISASLLGQAPLGMLPSIQSVPLPTPTDPAAMLYLQSVGLIIEQSRLSLLDGIGQLFAGRDLLTPIFQASAANNSGTA